ncbi:MAG: hypothetical protein JNL58_11065 [Planctomyces sp.]|nr:hypothetical protein [Planctomyces sp.]
MKKFRIPILLALAVALAAPSALEARESRDDDGPASNSPAFLTSMPAEAEPSLFESSLTQKNEELEERISRLEAELNQPRHYGVDPSASIEQRLQRQEAGTGGLFGSIEVTFLQPSLSGAQSVFGSGTGRLLETEYQTGVRYVLGYVSDSGLGIRGRYWSFDNSTGYSPPYAPAVFGIQLQAADTEVTMLQRMRHLDLELSGGVRYGQLEYTNPPLTLYGPGIVRFEGFGPTASLNARRALGKSGFSLFGNVRGSVMIGDIRTASLLLNIPTGSVEDEVMTVFENQLGVAWNHNLTNQLLLEVRTAWETQYWSNSTLEDDFYGIGSNLALMGPTLAVELRY